MNTSYFSKFIYYITAFIGLSAVVCLHELGHYSFCKAFGIATPVFSIGFGPRIISKEINKTLFTISALPLGGYVAIKGMESNKQTKSHDDFNAKPYWQKVLIILGGIIYNLIFGFAVLHFLSPTRSTNTDEKRSDLIGPIGILQAIAGSASEGWRNLIIMLAILSINLGFINLLPLPILDGGQLLMVTIETLQGSPIASATKQMISSFTWIIFALLMFFTSTKDIFFNIKK